MPALGTKAQQDKSCDGACVIRRLLDNLRANVIHRTAEIRNFVQERFGEQTKIDSRQLENEWIAGSVEGNNRH